MKMLPLGGLAIVFLLSSGPTNAQQPVTGFKTHTIPGGAFTDVPIHDPRFQFAQAIELKAGGHVIRSSWRILKPTPGTSFVPGHENAKVTEGDTTLFSWCCALVSFDSVISGEGKTYIQLSVADGPGVIPYLWVIDASGPVAVASPKIEACSSPKGSIVAGAYSLRCGRASGAHTFKDGVFRELGMARSATFNVSAS